MLEFLNLRRLRVHKFLNLLLSLVIITFYVHLREVRVPRFLNDAQLQGPLLLNPALLTALLHCRCSAWQSIEAGLVSRGDRRGKAPCDGTFRIELLINRRSYLMKENTNENGHVGAKT